MPIINRQDAEEVDQYIRRFFDPGASCAQALRRLFVEKLDFASATGAVSLAKAPKNVDLPSTAERIASMEDLHVVYVPLSAPGPDRVRKAEAAAAAKLITDELHGDLLLVMTNPSCSQLHVIWPTFTDASPSLRRMIVERDLPRRTAVQQLSNIYWQWKDTNSIRLAVDRAFDIEAVTKDFFGRYKVVFGNVMAAVKGFGDDEEGAEAKKLFVQTLFNRLMFIYFLSRKGWLEFKGNLDYLNALRKDYPAQSEDKNFYTNRLQNLFFAGLNNKASRDVRSPVLNSLIGDVPFLNGGLFGMTIEDKRPGILVPDEAIDQILHELFDRFNFTVMESTPLDVEVAVDPEMLGKVFEELVTGRHESGSYYTPRPVVSFMCREALKDYLETQNTGASVEAIASFVDHKDSAGLTLSSAPKIGEALAKVKVVDPACGSGAYLLGMMQELVELMGAVYSAHLSHQALDLYKLKLDIIRQNLYGADIDRFAVNIAMLRLWLSLAIEYDGDVNKLPPLPNLNFKIVCGDSLSAPDPNPSVHATQFQMFRQAVHAASKSLARLKQEQMSATDMAKDRLDKQILEEEEQLSHQLSFAPAPKDSVDWRVKFAEVFDSSDGFDIAIANPPYRRQEGLGTEKVQLERLYPQVYASTADYHVYFYNRSLQLLRDGGVLSFITSNKYMRAGYGEKIRGFLPSALTLSQVIDFGDLPVFTAAAYPAIVVGQKTPPTEGHTLRVADLTAPVRHYLSASGKPVNRETVTAVMERLPTFLAESAVPVYPQVLLRKSGWILEDPALVRLFDRLMSQGIPLGKVVNGRIYAGIKTGLNDAFVINEAKRQELVETDPKSAEVIKPWLRGRDIKRWSVESAGQYLVAIQNSDDKDARNPWGKAFSEIEAQKIFRQTYPAVHDHLSKYELYEVVDRQGRQKKVGLRLREDQGKWWWELRACRFYREFAEPKVVWPDIARTPSFAWDTSGAHADMTLFFTTRLQPEYLALLNSTVAQFMLTFLTYSIRGGYLRLKRQWMELFPIPALAQSDIKAFQMDDSPTEEMSTELAFAAYDLTRDEARLLRAWHMNAQLAVPEADPDWSNDVQDDP